MPRSKHCIVITFAFFIALVYFRAYVQEEKLLESAENESKELRDSNNIQTTPVLNSLETDASGENEGENVDDEELFEAIEEVIENIEHQVERESEEESHRVDGNDNEKVDDEELMEAIEEVIENIENNVQSESEESEEGEGEQLIEAIEEVVENIVHPKSDGENEEVDDEDLMEAIEEVIENIENQIENDSEANANLGVNNAESNVHESSKAETKTATELLDQLITAKNKLEARIREDYGPWFDAFFSKESIKEVTEISDNSTERLITLFQSKILSAQLTDEKTTFVWTTGGHSAAAGHGNLFSQSYTAILEDTAKDVFASLGIEFVGRNHAMGGYSSGPELGCCMNSIYGKDTDILSWDFGMTDGRDPHNMILWSHRAALLRDEGLPFLFYMKHPDAEVINLESKGLGIGWRNAIDVKKLPDFETIDPQVIKSIPEAVQYFRCGDHYETQGTICSENKWNTSMCEHANYQASWHPGWRAHMMNGRILGFFIIDVLVQAMERLLSSDSQISTSQQVSPGMTLEYFDLVMKEEKDTKERFLSGPVPEKKFGAEDFLEHDVPNEILYHSESICHSGLLPSMARYNLDAVQDESYSLQDLPTFPESGVRPAYLVYDPNKRQECETPLNIDYKDYYLTRSGDGLTTITLPSGMELGSSEDLYLPDRVGLIMICQTRCDWGKCEEGSIQLHTLNSTSTHLDITVNGEKVVGTQRIENYCYFLEKSKGLLNWGEGKQYEISFRVNEPNSFLEISSMIVY